MMVQCGGRGSGSTDCLHISHLEGMHCFWSYKKDPHISSVHNSFGRVSQHACVSLLYISLIVMLQFTQETLKYHWGYFMWRHHDNQNHLTEGYLYGSFQSQTWSRIFALVWPGKHCSYGSEVYSKMNLSLFASYFHAVSVIDLHVLIMPSSSCLRIHVTAGSNAFFSSFVWRMTHLQ